MQDLLHAGKDRQELDTLIAGLNPEQQSAVHHLYGPALVLAGAGSGKTRVVTLRIANLIANGIPANSILAVTFTNKAAQEMKERVAKFTHEPVTVATFHSLGARMLRESIHHLGMNPQFAIYDEEDTHKLMRQAAKEVFGSEGKIEIKAVASFISSCKNRLLRPEMVTKQIDENGYAEIYERYIRKLKECNAVDFDDLLYLPVLLLEQFPEVLEYYQNRFRFILVDEYQDTNFSQSRFIQLLTAKERNLFVVGDPDQSIYSWRGAIVEHILRFEKEYPGAIVLKLQQNYRSTETILSAANSVIANNSQRFDKALWSTHGEGEKITLFSAESERREAEFVAGKIAFLHREQGVRYSDIAIFYRTNFQSRPFEDALISRRIPYKIIGGISFYLRKEIKDVLCFLKLLANPYDEVSFNRVINLPKRGLGEVVLNKLSYQAKREGVSLLDCVTYAVATDFSGFEVSLTAKQKEGLSQFARIMNLLQQLNSTPPLSEVVRAAVFDTGYLQYLDLDTETREERRANVEELVAKAIEWEEGKQEATLEKFLEEIALVSATDTLDVEQDRVNIMTVHNAKGLEFNVVFVVGLEEDLFPHINSKMKPEQIEEERRLFYVGMTRAKKILFLSCARQRYLWGGLRSMRTSRFLYEVPKQYLKTVMR